jgi:hypothetical protein
MLKHFTALAIFACALLIPASADADFRYGNSWMIGRAAAERSSAAATVRGAETNYNSVSVYDASCRPSRDAAHQNGQYHHFRCVANIGRYYYWVAFDYWQIGQRAVNNRWTDITFYACTIQTCPGR